MAELNILLIFMILGAIVAIEVKHLLSSVIAVGAVGLGLSLVFLDLKAPDVAIVQLVVEILSVIYLIRATLKRDLPYKTEGGLFLHTMVALIFIIIFLIFAMQCLYELQEFGHPIMRVARTYLEESLSKTGAANIVSAIILDFRGYDTLGEATILFTAVVGVLAIMREIGRKKDLTHPSPSQEGNEKGGVNG